MSVTCIVREGKHSGANVNDTFRAAEKLLAERLEDLDFAGRFELVALDGVRGSSANQGIRVSRDDGLLIIQPGSNDSAWKYQLCLARGSEVPMADVVAKLKEWRPAEKAAKPAPPVYEETPGEIIERLLSDCEALACDLHPLFPHLGHHVVFDQFIAHCERQLTLSREVAERFARALHNRKLMKTANLRNETYIALQQGKLFDAFALLGVPKVAPAPPVGETPAFSSRASARADAAAALASGVRAKPCPPGDALKPNPVRSAIDRAVGEERIVRVVEAFRGKQPAAPVPRAPKPQGLAKGTLADTKQLLKIALASVETLEARKEKVTQEQAAIAREEEALLASVQRTLGKP